MRVLMRKIWDNDGYFLMGSLTALTFGIGAILSNPYASTFSTGKGWEVFAALAVLDVHPTEEQWGIIFIALSLFQLTSMWLLSKLVEAIDTDQTEDDPERSAYGIAKIVWGLTTSIYLGMATSFFWSNPVGIGFLLLLMPCVFALRALTRVRQAIERAGEKLGSDGDA